MNTTSQPQTDTPPTMRAITQDRYCSSDTWELTDIGLTATTFKAGDRVVVSGSPGRDRTPMVYVWRLERPADGFLYEQIGTSPRVSRLRR